MMGRSELASISISVQFSLQFSNTADGQIAIAAGMAFGHAVAAPIFNYCGSIGVLLLGSVLLGGCIFLIIKLAAEVAAREQDGALAEN